MKHTDAHQLLKDAIKDQGVVQLSVHGDSMRPLLHKGDRVSVARLDRGVVVGDVLLFSYADQLILHRLIGIENESHCLVMRGDHNESVERIRENDVMGVMTEVQYADGKQIQCSSAVWRHRSRINQMIYPIRSFLRKHFNAEKRAKMMPWYFMLLVIVMWAPLNGLGVPLDNFVLGIRLDHLLHASVFVPCTWFLATRPQCRYGWIWLLGVLVGVVTESGQYLLPYRGFDINDMVANALGVSLGWFLYWVHRRGNK